MYHYVNHQAIREVFVSVEAEQDPQTRAEMLDKIEHEFADLLLAQYERTCWELKHHKRWNTGQIADTLDISERKVKTFIRWYSERTGEWNPLARPKAENVIDISHLVQRRDNQAIRRRSTGTNHDEDGRVSRENLASGELANQMHTTLHDSVLSAHDT